MVQELSKLHGHQGEALGGLCFWIGSLVRAVGNLPWALIDRKCAWSRYIVRVGGMCEPSHGDAGSTPQLVIHQVVTDTVNPPELVSDRAGVAGDVTSHQATHETVYPSKTFLVESL